MNDKWPIVKDEQIKRILYDGKVDFFLVTNKDTYSLGWPLHSCTLPDTSLEEIELSNGVKNQTIKEIRTYECYIFFRVSTGAVVQYGAFPSADTLESYLSVVSFSPEEVAEWEDDYCEYDLEWVDE